MAKLTHRIRYKIIMQIFVCRVSLSFLLAFWQPNRMFTLFLRLFFLQILKFWSTLFWRLFFFEILKFWICSFFVAAHFWEPTGGSLIRGFFFEILKFWSTLFWRLVFFEFLKFWICSFFVAAQFYGFTLFGGVLFFSKS